MMRWILIALMLVVTNAFAVEDIWQFDNPAQQQLFNQLKEELRCPKCQNQNIADSNAVVAKDLQRKLYQLIKQGKDREQILQYMKERYGDFVHYQPPVTPLTWVLWVLPVLAIVLGAIFVLRRRTTQTTELDVSEAKRLLGEE